MKKQELKEIRLKIKFDMDSFATCIGIPKSTYARYEDGSATVPERVERAALELEQINKTFIEGLPGRVDARIAKDFPKGIPSNLS